MLDQGNIEKITQHIYSSDQDFFFGAGLYGEPFLFRDILCYFDGETLTIVGYPFNKEYPEIDLAEEIHDLLSTWETNPSVKIINYFGIGNYDFRKSIGKHFESVYFLEPDADNVDVFIDLSDPLLLKTSAAKESIRAVKHRGILVLKSKRNYLTHHHISLIRQTALREDFYFSDAALLTNINSILHDNHLIFFEAEFEKRLIGFIVVHEFFEKKPFAVIGCYEKSFPNIADAIYVSIIRHFLDTGSEWVGFGYSIDKGLLYFKTKWGGARTNLPYYQQIWKKKDDNTDSVDCLNWIARLLKKKLNQKMT